MNPINFSGTTESYSGLHDINLLFLFQEYNNGTDNNVRFADIDVRGPHILHSFKFKCHELYESIHYPGNDSAVSVSLKNLQFFPLQRRSPAIAVKDTHSVLFHIKKDTDDSVSYELDCFSTRRSPQ